MNDYRKYALCALSFFRHRWDKEPRYKTSTRKQQSVTKHTERCQTARRYIKKARLARQEALPHP